MEKRPQVSDKAIGPAVLVSREQGRFRIKLISTWRLAQIESTETEWPDPLTPDSPWPVSPNSLVRSSLGEGGRRNILLHSFWPNIRLGLEFPAS
jgi:hypothetical protein